MAEQMPENNSLQWLFGPPEAPSPHFAAGLRLRIR
jgi:hypothetical protein